MQNKPTLKEVTKIKEKFEEEYFFKAPFLEYVNMCGISAVGLQDKNAPPEEKDTLCISVGLRKPLEGNLWIPDEYQGVRVFVRVIGEIRAL